MKKSHIKNIVRLYPLLLIILGQISTSFPPTSKKVHDFNIEQYPHKAYIESLQSLCNTTNWNPNLYLNCTNIIIRKERVGEFGEPQGLFNVKSAMMSCVRWAIDIGGGFIIPRFAFRNEKELGYFSEFGDFKMLFDDENLKKVVSENCPQLKIFDTHHNITYQKIVAPEHTDFSFHTLGTYKKRVDKLLENHNADPNILPVVIWENRASYGWDFSKEGSKIHKSMFESIQFQPYLCNIGNNIKTMIGPSKFIGFHLRIESDANWYTYEDLVSWFLEGLTSNYSDIDTFYISVGVEDLERRFKQDMSNRGYTVYSKWSFASLNSTLKEELGRLNFDQNAIVDFEVIRHSYAFFGVAASSFSYAVAFDMGNGDPDAFNCHVYDGPYEETFKRGY